MQMLPYTLLSTGELLAKMNSTAICSFTQAQSLSPPLQPAVRSRGVDQETSNIKDILLKQNKIRGITREAELYLVMI